MRDNYARISLMTLAVVLACFLTASCETDMSRAAVPPKESPAPQAVVHRDFVIEVDEAATRMLEERRGGNLENQLSAHYTKAGYITLGELFSRDASAPSRKSAAAVRWQCPLSDVRDSTITEAAQRVAEIRQSGDYRQALTAASAAIDQHPDSCQLRVEWAAAVLMSAIVDRSAISTSDQERAVRALVTSAADVVILPEGYIGRGQVLRDVAWYFKASGDMHARRGALLIARRLLAADEAATTVPALKAAHAKLLTEVDRQLSE